MIRNAIAYHLPAGWPWNAVELSELLSRRAFQPVGQMAHDSSGFVPPQEFGELCHVVQHLQLVCLQTEERILPAYVVTEHAEEKAAEIEKMQGYKVGRRQMREIKEQSLAELLPQAFTRKRRAYAWIDRVAGLLVVDAPSQNRAEDVLEAMRAALDVLPVEMLRTRITPTVGMADWLAAGEAPEDYTIDHECALEAVTEDGATVRYSRSDLGGDDVRAHIVAGKLPKLLALTFKDSVSFVLTERLEIKRIEFLDMLTQNREQADDAEEQFDADFLLAASEIGQLIGNLVEQLGGHMETKRDDLVDQAAGDVCSVFSKLAESVTRDGGSMTLSTGDGRVIFGAGNEHDPLYADAKRIVIKQGKPSISLVQRHLRIGYNRAARLIEQMERDGIVSANSSPNA